MNLVNFEMKKLQTNLLSCWHGSKVFVHRCRNSFFAQDIVFFARAIFSFKNHFYSRILHIVQLLFETKMREGKKLPNIDLRLDSSI